MGGLVQSWRRASGSHRGCPCPSCGPGFVGQRGKGRGERGPFGVSERGVKVRWGSRERCQHRSASLTAETCLGFVPSSIVTLDKTPEEFGELGSSLSVSDWPRLAKEKELEGEHARSDGPAGSATKAESETQAGPEIAISLQMPIISGKKKAPALLPCCLSPALAPTQTALGRPLGLAELLLTCCHGEPGPQAGGRPPHGGRRRAFSPGVLALSGSICSRPPKETL